MLLGSGRLISLLLLPLFYLKLLFNNQHVSCFYAHNVSMGIHMFFVKETTNSLGYDF